MLQTLLKHVIDTPLFPITTVAMGAGASSAKKLKKIKKIPVRRASRFAPQRQIDVSEVFAQRQIDVSEVSEFEEEWNLQTYDSWEDVDESPEGYDDKTPLPPCRIDHDAKAKLLRNFCRGVQQDPTKFLANFDENRIGERVHDDSSCPNLETDLAVKSV